MAEIVIYNNEAEEVFDLSLLLDEDTIKVIIADIGYTINHKPKEVTNNEPRL